MTLGLLLEGVYIGSVNKVCMPAMWLYNENLFHILFIYFQHAIPSVHLNHVCMCQLTSLLLKHTLHSTTSFPEYSLYTALQEVQTAFEREA